MFENLRIEMERKNITIQRLADDKKLGLCYSTLNKKIKGRTEWLRSEMLYIRDNFFPDKTLEYLFEWKD